jgi:hypothetical protein
MPPPTARRHTPPRPNPMAFRVLALALLHAAAAAGEIVLATFAGEEGTTHSLKQTNDPVIERVQTRTMTLYTKAKINIKHGSKQFQNAPPEV